MQTPDIVNPECKRRNIFMQNPIKPTHWDHHTLIWPTFSISQNWNWYINIIIPNISYSLYYRYTVIYLTYINDFKNNFLRNRNSESHYIYKSRRMVIDFNIVRMIDWKCNGHATSLFFFFAIIIFRFSKYSDSIPVFLTMCSISQI